MREQEITVFMVWVARLDLPVKVSLTVPKRMLKDATFIKVFRL